ncbi:MAG: ABC transporter ATP-binding protein [Planctomycetes bacterium]|nr:ABC transporter ATP-binding protein [Planctomycetota bacterium]
MRILKGVSLQVSQGELVAIIGANGAGKTTTLMAICGMVPVMSGRILFHGEDITNLPTVDIVRRGLTQVPEGRRLFSDLTVLENLEMGAFQRRDRSAVEKDLEACFQLFPVLGERKKQLAGSLSGGEQQMCAMARALVARPSVLLLDEPSLGLSPILVRQIFDVIEELNREGTTILLVEQNALKALQCANRGYVMETGQVALAGPGRDLLEDEKVKKAYLGYS